MKKLIISILSAALLMSLMVSVSSAAGVTRASDCLSSYSTDISSAGGGRVLISFSATAVSLADTLGATQIDVQKKSGSSWTSVSTYNSGLLGSNRLVYGTSVTYSGTSGTEYRAVITVYAKIGSRSDSKSVTTSSVVA